MSKVTPVHRVIPMNNNPRRKAPPLPEKYKSTPPPDDAG